MMDQKEDLLTGRTWNGRPCFVIGGGPSLRAFDFNRLNGSLTIGTNRSFEFYSSTVLLAIDARFFRWVYQGKYGPGAIMKLDAYEGIKVGIRISQPHLPGVREIKALGVSGPIVPIEEGIYHGNNSGYSAVALALALGADPVYVLGIDLRYDGRQTHFHSGHSERTPERMLLIKCLPSFIDLSKTAEGKRVKIVNPEYPARSFSHLSHMTDFETIPFPEVTE